MRDAAPDKSGGGKMKLHYSISQEEYLEALTAQLRRRRTSAVNLIVLALLTAGQMAFAIWNVANGRLSGAAATAVLLLSAVICALQLAYQLLLPQRARHVLERDIRAGKISSDFWKPQTLSLENDLLEIRCGKQKLRYDCAYFQKAEQCGPMLVLTMKKEAAVHQLMIPLTALGGPEESESFLETLAAAKRASILAGYEAALEKPPEETNRTLRCTYGQEEFARAFVRSAREAYLTPAGWTPSTLARLAGTAFLLYHLSAGSFHSTAYKIFSVAVCMLLCYPYLISFSPLIYPIARKYTRSLFAGLDTLHLRLDEEDDGLIFSAETFFNRIPRSAVKAVRETETDRFYYLKDGTAITMRKK